MLIKATVDGMASRGFGRIVNITSRSVKTPLYHLPLSNAARAGLTGMVAGLARQWRIITSSSTTCCPVRLTKSSVPLNAGRPPASPYDDFVQTDGQQVVDDDVMMRHLGAPVRPPFRSIRRAPPFGKRQVIERRLHRTRRDVDDASETCEAMPSTVALISITGATRLGIRPASHFCSSRRGSRRAADHPHCLMRMSGSGQASSKASRPFSVVTSATTGVTLPRAISRIEAAVA